MKSAGPADVLAAARLSLLREYAGVGGVICLLASAAFAFGGAPSPDRFVMLACGVVWLVVATLHRSIRPTVAATALGASIAVSVSLNSVYNGGMDSPGSVWLAIVPLIGGLLAGRRAMLAGLVISALAMVFLVWAKSKGLTHASTLEPSVLLVLRSGNVIGLAIFLGVAMLLSDRVSTRVTGSVVLSNTRLQEEVDDHEATRRKLENLYCELVDIARQAGMGQVATGVLHNVGNALNGVTTSVALAMAEVNHASPSLERVAALVEQTELAIERRQTIATYLRRLDASYGVRLGRIHRELACIRDASEHMASVVSAQQEIATTSGMVERVPLSQVVAQAHLLLNTSLVRHEIELSLDIPSELIVTIDRHRAVQILTNLLGNARDAMRDVAGERHLNVRAVEQNGWIAIHVTDTGAGVAESVADRVFEHGFTTKSDGHGFGLHSSALAATEMGGRLSLVTSAAGAHFLLSVPNLGWEETSRSALDPAVPKKASV